MVVTAVLDGGSCVSCTVTITATDMSLPANCHSKAVAKRQLGEQLYKHRSGRKR